MPCLKIIELIWILVIAANSASDKLPMVNGKIPTPPRSPSSHAISKSPKRSSLIHQSPALTVQTEILDGPQDLQQLIQQDSELIAWDTPTAEDSDSEDEPPQQIEKQGANQGMHESILSFHSQ